MCLSVARYLIGSRFSLRQLVLLRYVFPWVDRRYIYIKKNGGVNSLGIQLMPLVFKESKFQDVCRNWCRVVQETLIGKFLT